MNELISIIVPAYNVENYVERTINSIIAQTYKNIEIICVDDGSNDKTKEVLEKLSLRDNRVKVFSKVNEGVNLARKYGVEKASGEYIGFVDADDVIESNMYEKLYYNAKKYNADISHCGIDMINIDGSKELFYNTGKFLKQKNIEAICSLLLGKFEPGLGSKIFRAKLIIELLQSNKLDFNIKENEDLLLNYYLFKMSNVSVFEDLCLYHYIKRKGSATSTFTLEQMMDQIKVKQIILEDSGDTKYYDVAMKSYLLKCINIYKHMIKSKNIESYDKENVRLLLVENKKAIRCLDVKHREIANMIIYFPILFKKTFKRFMS